MSDAPDPYVDVVKWPDEQTGPERWIVVKGLGGYIPLQNVTNLPEDEVACLIEIHSELEGL